MKTRPVGPDAWRVYLGKAEEFHRLMADAERRSDWNGVGLAAVHAVISAADAVVSRFRQERSASPDHGESVDLLLQLDVPRIAEKAKQAAEVIGAKDLVECQARDYEAKEARATARKADRFLEWAQETLRRK